MDTGSSDLFLDTTGVDLNGATNTGHHVGLIYGYVSLAIESNTQAETSPMLSEISHELVVT